MRTDALNEMLFYARRRLLNIAKSSTDGRAAANVSNTVVYLSILHERVIFQKTERNQVFRIFIRNR